MSIGQGIQQKQGFTSSTFWISILFLIQIESLPETFSQKLLNEILLVSKKKTNNSISLWCGCLEWGRKTISTNRTTLDYIRFTLGILLTFVYSLEKTRNWFCFCNISPPEKLMFTKNSTLFCFKAKEDLEIEQLAQ